MREFGRGVGMLRRGFGWWRREPGVMALALVPAVLAAVVLLAGVAGLIAALPWLTDAVTPFADGWPEVWQTVLRVAVAAAVVSGAVVVAVVSFTALTLLIGEPFYDRVWRSVERGTDAAVPDAGYGWAAAGADSARLFGRGLGVAALTAVLGLVPVVGGVLAAVTGVVLTGGILADELSSRALTARGLDRRARAALGRAHRGRMLGFGVATQLCFLVPLGAVVVMPAAVAGSTLLAQSLLKPPESP